MMIKLPSSIKLLTCLLFSLSVVNKTQAQYDYIKQGYQSQSYLPYSLHRLQIGFSSVGAVASCKGDLYAIKADGSHFEQYFDGATVSKGGLGITLGTFYRMVKMGRKTAIAADVNLMYNYLYWKGIARDYYPDDKWSHAATTRQLALPLGLDLKFGLDGRLEKNHRFCLSFGGGIMPQYNNTRLEEVETENKRKPKYGALAAPPYLKAEAGVFMGICFKLRFMWTVGDYKLAKEASMSNKVDKYGFNNFNITGKSSFTVSLLAMPFSYDWPDNGWWNNSRTSGTFYPWK